LKLDINIILSYIFFDINKLLLNMLNPKILKIKKFINKSGRLLAVNSFDKKLFPYRIKRIFFVDSKKNAIRGKHAHIFCSQLIVCLEGKIEVTIYNSNNKEYFFEINNSNKNALLLPKKHWVILKSKAKYNLIAVLCDYKYYKKKDYINSFKQFLKK